MADFGHNVTGNQDLLACLTDLGFAFGI